MTACLPRRHLLACAALLLALAACAPPRPAEGPATPATGGAPTTKLTVYTPHGREMLEPFAERWAADHPEITLETVDMGAQQVFDRLRAEQANPIADVWWGAPHTTYAQATELGLLEPYKPTWADRIAPERRDPADHWYGQWLTPGVIVYNSAAVKEQDAPTDWDDLLDARWKDKIIIRDPLSSGTMRSFIAAMIQRAPSIDAGFEWLARLDANTVTYAADPALLFRQFQAQEGVLTVWNLRDVFIQRRDHDYQLGYVLPKSGSPMVVDAIGIVAGTKHRREAEIFYEWATAPAQMAFAAEQFYCLPAIDLPGLELPSDMPAVIPELHVDWEQVRTDGDEWMRRWNTTIKGRGSS